MAPAVKPDGSSLTGQAGVNDDVMEPDRHGVRGVCAGTPDWIPRTGLLLPRSAHVTAGAASGDIADQLGAAQRVEISSRPPGGASPPLRAGLTIGRHPLARR